MVNHWKGQGLLNQGMQIDRARGQHQGLNLGVLWLRLKEKFMAQKNAFVLSGFKLSRFLEGFGSFLGPIFRPLERGLGKVFLFAILLLSTSCAYRWGENQRSLPGGYRQIFVPIFKNSSMEPGVEIAFTNFFIQEIERAQVARVVERERAEVVLEGEITEVTSSGEQITNEKTILGFSQARQYLLNVVVRVQLKRLSDGKTLHSGTYSRQRTYKAPSLTQAGLNSMNPLYNRSAQHQNIETMAKILMAEAHDRLTDNF